jgi:hypothetical protein
MADPPSLAEVAGALPGVRDFVVCQALEALVGEGDMTFCKRQGHPPVCVRHQPNVLPRPSAHSAPASSSLFVHSDGYLGTFNDPAGRARGGPAAHMALEGREGFGFYENTSSDDTTRVLPGTPHNLSALSSSFFFSPWQDLRMEAELVPVWDEAALVRPVLCVLSCLSQQPLGGTPMYPTAATPRHLFLFSLRAKLSAPHPCEH